VSSEASAWSSAREIHDALYVSCAVRCPGARALWIAEQLDIKTDAFADVVTRALEGDTAHAQAALNTRKLIKRMAVDLALVKASIVQKSRSLSDKALVDASS